MRSIPERIDAGEFCGEGPQARRLFLVDGVEAVTNEAVYLGGVPDRFVETAGLIDTLALGAKLAAASGQASTVLMRKHGISFVGPSIAVATMMDSFLERPCRSQLALLAMGHSYADLAAGDDIEERANL